MTKTAILGLLAMVGCGAAPGVPVERHGLWVDPGVNQTAVVRGCKVWDVDDCAPAASRETARIVVSPDGQTDCAPFDDAGHVWLGDGGTDGTINLRVACWPQVNGDWDQFVGMASTVAHEIGHAFGLGHVSAQGAVMYWLVGTAMELTEADRIEWERATH